MRVVAMVSGGKDSCYNMMQCAAEGHEIVALANLHPKDQDELDSFMYQTVGHMGIEVFAKAMTLPLYRRETNGLSMQRDKHYIPTDNDEVEDLYEILHLCKNDLNVEGVAVGAILSDYQRIRVENVCSRLNLVSLAYLWRRNQTELLQEMIDCQVQAILIKVASLGLMPEHHLGKTLREMQPHLLKMGDKYGLNVCGEGGEYETFTLDCPLFKQRIVIDDMQTVISSSDPICPVGYINFTKLSLEAKDPQQSCDVIIKKSMDYISDLNESTYSDFSDPELSETELELIEKETRLRKSLCQNELISRSNSFGRHLTAPSSSSPVPVVKKSASVDEQTPLNLLSSSTALCNTPPLQAGSSPHLLNWSTAALFGSPSLAISSLGLHTVAAATSTGTIKTVEAQQSKRSYPLDCGDSDEISASFILTQPLIPFNFEREDQPLNNCPMVAINQQGWMWLTGVQGYSTCMESGYQKALNYLQNLAADHNYSMTDYCYITIYMHSIADYPTLNKFYGQVFNFHNPPTRVCVECPLPDNCQVIIDAIAYKALPRRRTPLFPGETENVGNNTKHLSFSLSSYTIPHSMDYSAARQTLHVQSLSHWAPANIGPYSQSTKINDIMYISGQIALIPGSMCLIEGGIRQQCKLTLRHISRIAKAMNATGGQLRDVVHGICFVTHPVFITEARHQWEKRTTNAIMDYIVVPALPREALVEWQVWAHTHNDQFEYEETGCSVGDYSVSIRRRWNYENNCAAVICYVATGLTTPTTQLTQLSQDLLNHHKHAAQSITDSNLDEILTYLISRLLKDYPLLKASSDNYFHDEQKTNITYTNGDPIMKSDNVATTKPSTLISNQNNNVSSNLTINIPAIHLKVFYQVKAAPSIDLLLKALTKFREKCAYNTANIVFTVLPASSLHNFTTFLSVCGIRHE